MSLKKQALSGMLWTFTQQFSTQGISFAVSIVLARLLLPSEFGLIAMIGIFIGLGSALINSGLTTSLVRTLDPDEDDFSTVFYFNLFASIIVYLIVYFLAPYIAVFYNQELLTLVVRVYSITFITNAFSAIQIARLTKILDFKTQMLVTIPSLILSSIVGLTMAYNGYGVWSLVYSALVQSILSTLQLWFRSKWVPRRSFNLKKFSIHYHYGIKMMFSSILDIIFTNAYTIIIGRFFLPAQVGFYNRAQTLQMLPVGNISSVLGKVTFPIFASLQNDNERLKNAFSKIMKMVVFLVAPILIFMSVLAEPLFRFLFTEKWLPSVPYFQIICINGILYPIHSYNLQILSVKGYSGLFLKLEIIKKVVIAITIVLSFRFGIIGLLYGSVFASIICFFINSFYSGKFLNYNMLEQFLDLFPIIMVALISGLFVYGIDYFMKLMHSFDFIRLVVGAGLGIILYIMFSYIFKINSLKEIKNIILKK